MLVPIILMSIALILFVFIEIRDVREYRKLRRYLMEDFYVNAEDNYQAQQINDFLNMEE